MGIPPPPDDGGLTGATGVCAAWPVTGFEDVADAGGTTSAGAAIGAAGAAIGADAGCIGGPKFDTVSGIGGDWIGA